MNAVELANVTKTFGKYTAVDDVSLAVPKGAIYGFIGPNGSGKTTTMRMIMNIFYPDSGAIRVFGEKVDGNVPARTGYLPEERGLYKAMKVREILRFYGGLRSGQKNLAREVDQWLERLDLTEWANKKVQTLSKGMSQKVQFIATVVPRPDLLILDEPFAGLDPVNLDTIRSAVLELREKGSTVILSTHDMNIAETMCDFIFMIFKGKKVLDGTLAAIQEDYGHDTLHVRCDGGLAALQDLPGVANIVNLGQTQELHLDPDGDPRQILSVIVSRTTVRSFEIAKPSLHDIFVRIAKPDAKEAPHA